MSSKDEEIIDQFLTDIDADGQDLQEGVHGVQNVQEVSDILDEQDGQPQEGLNKPHEEQQKSQMKMKHSIDPTMPTSPRAKRTKPKDLPVFTKWAIVARYFEAANREADRLYPGSLPELCDQFGVSKRTIQRVVGEYKAEIAKGIKIPDLSNKKSGRFDVKAARELEEKIAKLKKKAKKPLTVRQLATEYEKEYGLKVSYMRLFRHGKRMQKDPKPIKYSKKSPPLQHQHPVQHHQYQHISLTSESTSSSVGNYALFAEQDALSNAAGLYHLHQYQHQQLYNPQVRMFAIGVAALPISHMPLGQEVFQHQQQQTVPQAQEQQQHQDEQQQEEATTLTTYSY